MSTETAPQTSYDTAAIDAEGRGDDDQTWAIYWYLCASDLESKSGCATDDILEMLDVKLPDNVKLVIQTGGTAKWRNNTMNATKSERYLYSSEGFQFIERNPQCNMGDPETLADFLAFCKKNYPADRTMVLFWNHGGGSVAGAAFDENYRNDSLTLGEFYEAFNEVYEIDAENPPIDIIGFDACLMATIDVAFTFCDIAQYLVASQEVEPGDGWYYNGWLQELADDPGMGPAKLGRVICDTYEYGCRENWSQNEITLSLTDLTKIEPLIEAYDAMGQEALIAALDDTSFFSSFGRQASRSENYGGNTYSEGYTNMVDLGHLARNTKELLPRTSQAVLDGLAECVIYSINGSYRNQATGLSCYYSFNGDKKDLDGYIDVGCSQAFKYLYDYGIDSNLSAEGMNYVNQLGHQEALPEVESFDSDEFKDDFPLYINKDGYVVLDIGKKTAEMVKTVYFHLGYIDENEGSIIMLGRDNDIDADWSKGIFLDNFRGVWGSIDGHLVHMELAYEGDDYNIYAVPILLNGEEYNLRVVYDYNEEDYYILGARKGLDSGGMSDRLLVRLRPGDKISTVLYASDIYSNEDMNAYVAETFTVTNKTDFEEVELDDGEYIMLFELVDSRNNSVWSDSAFFIIDGEDMYPVLAEG